MDKFSAWQRLHFDVMFHGSDWKGSQMFIETEKKLASVGCDVVFLPHTEGVSSTILTDKTKESIKELL